ncbi:HK97 family phage prohead protease [uncultured Eubacterium sp.]|uniref:HK97 family phage prohead protease n=1 Tax=uncultured Eubacterium sp. TaxID=165185 RepID=UPI00261067BD|nr:HK97 family phage prohead protease [uncultured Eubacterium sp.]
MEIFKRNYSFEIRANEDKENKNYTLTGRPIVYNSKTDLGYFDEIIEAGALDKANLKDVRFLVNHDTSKIPLARATEKNKNSTMRFSVDKNGMEISVELDVENNSEARALYSAVQRGDITGMSFMFTIDGEEWENLESEHPTRHIKSIGQVFEVSAVTFPAYEASEISARDKKSLDDAVNKARSNDLDLLKLKAKYIYK